MDFTPSVKIKEEPLEEIHSYMIPSPPPSEDLHQEYFQDNVCVKEEFQYSYNNEVGLLDEWDGTFKTFTDVIKNQFKNSSEDDYKNYCVKCKKQFDNLLATQNHYIFNHSDLSQLENTTLPCTTKLLQIPEKVTNKLKENYNWLDEPIKIKETKNNKPESNVIILKDPTEYLKKFSSTKKLVELTENGLNNSIDKKEYTLESIKARPLEGIKVVKKSDIRFNELLTKAEKKITRKKIPPKEQPRIKPPKEIKQDKRFIKINNEEASNPQSKLFKEFVRSLKSSQLLNVKYLCKKCNLELSDVLSFDSHMRKHINPRFCCSFCSRRFCTKVGMLKHAEFCKEN